MAESILMKPPSAKDIAEAEQKRGSIPNPFKRQRFPDSISSSSGSSFLGDCLEEEDRLSDSSESSSEEQEEEERGTTSSLSSTSSSQVR
jgi:hypothetical protein